MSQEDEEPRREPCQRCGEMGTDPSIVYLEGRHVDLLSLPLHNYAMAGSCGLDHWGLWLCEECREDWFAALGYWWISMPGHVLMKRVQFWDVAYDRRMELRAHGHRTTEESG